MPEENKNSEDHLLQTQEELAILRISNLREMTERSNRCVEELSQMTQAILQKHNCEMSPSGHVVAKTF